MPPVWNNEENLEIGKVGKPDSHLLTSLQFRTFVISDSLQMDVEFQKLGMSKSIKAFLLLFELWANSEYLTTDKNWGVGWERELSFAFMKIMPAGPVHWGADLYSYVLMEVIPCGHQQNGLSSSPAPFCSLSKGYVWVCMCGSAGYVLFGYCYPVWG